MKYIMTIFWALAISAAVSYVLTSMAGEPFVLFDSVLLAIVLIIAVLVIGTGVLKQENE